ncbi:MAG TPA: YceI family protein [Acidimicrobiales bacterium]|nr:YceI family protein [Acidimicrobiales bacterium]
MARSRGRTFGIITGIVVVVIAVAAFAGWWFLIRDDAPSEADIATAVEGLDDSGGATGDVEGDWGVDPSVGSFDDFSSTWAGYRFEEELASIGTNTAVGRTPDVTGSMTVAGDEVTAVDVEVDLTTLQSDSGTRDGALRSRGLESDEFPSATFSLTEPIALPAGAADGERVSTEATGDLTIHGTTKSVTLTVEAELSGDSAVVVGQAPVVLQDHGIEPPTGFSVLSIDDEGTFEFQIFFSKG